MSELEDVKKQVEARKRQATERKITNKIELIATFLGKSSMHQAPLDATHTMFFTFYQGSGEKPKWEIKLTGGSDLFSQIGTEVWAYAKSPEGLPDWEPRLEELVKQADAARAKKAEDEAKAAREAPTREAQSLRQRFGL